MECGVSAHASVVGGRWSVVGGWWSADKGVSFTRMHLGIVYN